MTLLLFHILVAVHIACGSAGAVAFWVPVAGRKGGVNHRRWGRVFTVALLITGGCAIAMSVLTLIDPIGTHPHLDGRFEAPFIRGMFGWMMLQTGILTINLVWYGWMCVKNGRNTAANRTVFNMALQPLVMLAAVNCAWQGWLIGQPLMMGIAVVGVATGVTNLVFLLAAKPRPTAWLKEHIKGLVGAGISVYTAFMAFGSVRLVPELALNPVMWAIPLATGVGLIIYHWRRIDRGARRPAAARAASIQPGD